MQPELSAELEGKLEYVTTIIQWQTFQWDSFFTSPVGIITIAVTALVVVKMAFQFVFKLSLKIPLFGYKKVEKSDCHLAPVRFASQEGYNLYTCSICGKICALR